MLWGFCTRKQSAGFHGAEFLFFQKTGLKTAPQKFRRDNRQVKIKIMGNDRLGFLHIGIELREHLKERHTL